MFFKILYAEWTKLKRSPVWLAFFLLPILPAFMGTFNYLQNTGILQEQWYSLWTQHTLFSCYFFFPAIIGVYCSYLWRLEHTSHNWNLVMTMPIPVRYIYLSKLFTASVMVFFTQLWTGVLFVASGKLSHLEGPVPPELLNWLLCGFIGGIVISAVQLCLSLVIRSFAVPVGIAVAGAIGGVAALSKGYGVMYPYSLPGIGMRVNSPKGPMACSLGQFFASSFIYLVFCTGYAVLWMKQRDAAAE